METEIKKTLNNNYEVCFSIGNQTFSLQEVKTKKEAIFYNENLKSALSKFTIENISDKFNDEWNKAQNKIINKNGYTIVPRFDVKKLFIRAAKKIHK